jgi:periplasmic protein TonB
MEAKKNPRMNPERDRKVFFHLGMFVTSASVLMAFTWRHPVYDAKKDYFEREVVEQDPYLVEEVPIEIPKIETVAPSTPSTPTNPEVNLLTPDITETGNIDQNETNRVNPDIALVGPINVNVDPGPAPDGVIPEFVDVEAHLPNWMPFLKSNLKYPEDSRVMGEQGKIYVKFIVEKDGTLTDVRIARGGYKSLEKEAMRVVKESPKWVPGTLNGEYVRSYRTVVINFVLGN